MRAASSGENAHLGDGNGGGVEIIAARDVAVLTSLVVEAEVDEVVTPTTETEAVRELDHRAPTHDVETAEHPSHGDDHDSLDAHATCGAGGPTCLFTISHRSR